MHRAHLRLPELAARWHGAEIEQHVEDTLDEIAGPLVYAEALTKRNATIIVVQITEGVQRASTGSRATAP